jgi:hypothetical protein
MGDSYISDAGNWWRFYQGYLFGYDNDPSTLFDFHAAHSWAGVLYRIFLVVTSFMVGILGIFFLQPDAAIPLPTLLAIVLTTGVIFLLIFGVRSVSAVSRKTVARFDLNLLAGALAALLLTIGLLSFGTQLANDTDAVPIGIITRITWKLALLICMICLCGLWVRSALESSDESGDQRTDRALLVGIVGGFCLLVGLLSVGRYWAAGKGLIMLSPILFIALVGSLLASDRLQGVMKVAVLVYVATQVSFGAYRSYAASRAGSDAFYSAPYPLDQYQKWRFRWDYAGLKDQLKSCSRVNVHSSGLYYELFVKMILTDLRIPWSTQDDGSTPSRADEPDCLLTTEVDDIGAKGEIIWAQRDDRLIKFYRGEASGLDLIPIPEGLETKGIGVEESRIVGVAWTDGHAVLRVPVGPKTPVKRLALAVGPERPSVDMHSVDMHIAVFVNGQRILEDDVPPNTDSSSWSKTVAVPHLRGESSLTIVIDSDEFLLPGGRSVGARLYNTKTRRP